MTYDTLKKQSGKRAVQIVELYIDRCSRSYGVAPCTAAIGVTGTKKCFNTFATCQDRANYDKTSVVYRFATTRVDGIQQPGDAPTFPTLASVESAPTVLTPGKGLGIRASVTVKIVDHPWTDIFCDPYPTSRSYTADNQGTFWGRFVTRNKYYEWRRLDVLTGFLEDDGSYNANNFVRRTYLITKISGPDPSGSVTIEAKDPLKQADNDKAQYPAASRATLPSDITSSTTSIVITDPDGAVAAQLAISPALSQPYLRIEDEILKVTAITSPSPLTVTVVRGSMPTYYEASLNVAADHDAGSTVQTTYEWNDVPVYDIVYFLLDEVSGIDPAYLPLSEWQTEIENGFSYLRFSRLLTEPVGVKDLLIELTNHGTILWWDERDQQVKMKGLRFFSLLTPAFNDDDGIIADSVGVTEDVPALITQTWTYFAHQWPLANKDLLRSYRIIDVREEVDVESADAYNRKQISSLWSRWMTTSDAGIASSIGSTMLRQYSEVRKSITIQIDPKDDDFWVGDVVGVSTRYVQDDEGLPTSRNYLITQVEEVWTGVGVRLRYGMQEQFNFLRTGLITHPNGDGSEPPPGPPPDYSAATTAEKNQWGYICANSAPYFPDATPPYQIT